MSLKRLLRSENRRWTNSQKLASPPVALWYLSDYKVMVPVMKRSGVPAQAKG